MMQVEKLGAKEKCSGTTDNLLFDHKVCQDSQRGRENLSMAWVNVRKAYYSADHQCLLKVNVQHVPLSEMDWQWHSRSQCEMEYTDITVK